MFAVLGLGEALGRAVGFAGTVYVARRLGADAYGIVAVAAAVVLYFSHIADFSVEVLGARTIASNPGEIGRLVPALLGARLALAAGCVVALSAVGLLFLPSPDGAVLAVTSVGLLAVAASTRFVFIGIERPISAAVAKVAGELLTVGLILLLVHDARDLMTVPWMRVVGDVAAAVLLFALLWRHGHRVGVSHAPATVRPLLTSAAPLVGHAILGLAIFNSDLIFLRAMRDARTAGMYAAAYTLISFLLNLGVAYGNSLLPVLTREGRHADPQRQRTLFDHAMIQVLTVALPVGAGGCLLAGGLMMLVFGDKYAEGIPALQVLIWSIVVAWVRNVVQMGLIARDKQSFVLRTSMWSAAANLLLNLLLIPRFGMVGAAVATLATETLRTVVAMTYSARLGLPFGVTRRLWRPVAATLGMAALLWLVPLPHVLLAVAAGAAAYGAALLATGGVRFTGGAVHLHV
jgi:O-antigen/teichoic acid export membrane protein